MPSVMHQTSSLNNFFFLVDRRYFLLSFPSVCSITRYIAAPEILVCSENGHKQLREILKLTDLSLLKESLVSKRILNIFLGQMIKVSSSYS